ncbi:MAG: hypothetical protein JSR36_05795 [Proteobacteria bacterium]|nr:hypothetical protein [Pseudomonadota bacterium]
MRQRRAAAATAVLVALWCAAPLQAAPLCTLLADPASGSILQRSGEHCAQRYTPASTFKIALVSDRARLRITMARSGCDP